MIDYLKFWFAKDIYDLVMGFGALIIFMVVLFLWICIDLWIDARRKRKDKRDEEFWRDDYDNL